MRGRSGQGTPSDDTVRMWRVTTTGGRAWIETAEAVEPTGTSASSNGQAQVHEQVGRYWIPGDGAGEARDGLEDAAHVATDLVEHVQPVALVAALVAQVLQAPLEHPLFVRHGDDRRPGVVAHREVVRVRREQLVVRRPGAQELDAHPADGDRVSVHRGRLSTGSGRRCRRSGR